MKKSIQEEPASSLMPNAYCLSLPSVSHEPQEEQKQVDEVEIKCKRTQYPKFPGIFFPVCTGTGTYFFKTLDIISGKPCKDKDTNNADQIFKGAAVQEEIDHHGQDNSDKPHHQD